MISLKFQAIHTNLFASSWFLTLFAAHFPLGFVARVFDLLFFEGSDAIIKVSICLLAECKEELLACESLEELMHVLKMSLPSLPASKLEDVVKQAASLSIGRQLHTYHVEYHVLQEEEASKKSFAERAKEQSEALATEVTELRDRMKEVEAREAIAQILVSLVSCWVRPSSQGVRPFTDHVLSCQTNGMNI